MKKIFSFIIAFLSCLNIYAQNEAANGTKDTIRTAAILKSGNSQDVLISFFQVALQDLNSSNHSFQFQSSLLAIKAKTDKSVMVDTNYLKETFIRNFTIQAGIGVDAGYKYKNSNFGFKYAIINDRDKSIFQFFIPHQKEWGNLYNKIMESVYKLVNNKVTDPRLQTTLDFFDRDKNIDENKLDPEVVKIINDCLQNDPVFKGSDINTFKQYRLNRYNEMVALVENKPLLVLQSSLTSDSSWKSISAFDINVEYLKGMLNPLKAMNLELDLKAAFDLSDDSFYIQKNLKRQVFSFSGGLNWIIAKNQKHVSMMELKASVSDNYIFNGLYKGETINKFTLNGTIRFRITDKIWLPISFMYDPKTANLFGLLNITSNFDALGAMSKN